MKTPWSNLIKYGVGIAAMAVMTICGVVLLAVIGIAVILSKISVFIK